MRRHFSIAAFLCALPALAAAADPSVDDLVRIFGRDPGLAEAHACFARRNSASHLEFRPAHNVTKMLVYISKSEGEDPNYGMTVQVRFKHLDKPFESYGSCFSSDDGWTLRCHVDCDGGEMSVKVTDGRSMTAEIAPYARFVDPANPDPSIDLPADATFEQEDKVSRVDRVPLHDCLPLIYDETLRAGINKGIITQ